MSVRFAAKSWCQDDKSWATLIVDRPLSARSIAVPLLGTLILAAMLLVLDKMLRLFDFVVNAGGPVSVVWRMLANLLPEYFALGIPIGLMLGILLAFRKLALSSELDALRGIGVGYGRLLEGALCLCVALLLLNLADRRLGRALFALPLRRPALRPAFGRARRGDQGRRVQPARQAPDAADRPQREEGHALGGIFIAVDDKSGHVGPRRRGGPLLRPTIPTRSSSG